MKKNKKDQTVDKTVNATADTEMVGQTDATVDTETVDASADQTDATVDTTVDTETVDLTVAHVDAEYKVKSEMDDIATIRDDIRTRTVIVKAIATKLMLWYVAHMPLHLELAEAIDKGRTKAFAKCGITAKGDKDAYGPVRGEFDGIKVRLLHCAIDPRQYVQPETKYEDFRSDSVIPADTPTVAGIRRAKREEEAKQKAEKALAEQVQQQTPGAVDMSEEYTALRNENKRLAEENDRLQATIQERDTEILALKAQIEVYQKTAEHARKYRSSVVEENKKLKSEGRAPSLATAEILS